jgi:DmsE family decaheme c-type cytochrome
MWSMPNSFRAGFMIAGIVGIVMLAGPARASAAGAARQAAPGAAQDAANYVGQDTCLTCHEQQDYKGTAHALKSNAKSPAATHGCESCHGPGKAHVDAGGDKTKIVNLKTLTPQRASETCVVCHDRSKHALWAGSQHDQRNVGCITCHSVHSPKGAKQIKAASEPELCATCHRNIVNRLYRFNHMPVREDKLQCSSCHNPHGSTNTKLLKTGTTVDEACTSCHAEKRGPYLWEHAPVANACVTCHDPHGSNNERMLAAKVPFLCQRCHVTSRHPPTVYEGFTLNNSQNANKMFGRGCVACHQQIHGSNAPSGKAFLR